MSDTNQNENRVGTAAVPSPRTLPAQRLADRLHDLIAGDGERRIGRVI